MNQLFKVLGNSEIFLDYINQFDTAKEIIDVALSDEKLMSLLTPLVDDVEMIRTKMEVVVGQRMKKKVNKFNDEKEKEKEEQEEEKEEEKKEKGIWLWPTCYLERVGTQMRLVNDGIEMYY
jgi:hypothetical protein